MKKKRKRKVTRKVVGFKEIMKMTEDLTKITVASSVGLKVIDATKR